MRPSPLQIWGGIECTVNRVGDTYFDQFKLSGHDGRLGDLDLVADLGIKTLRYPVLWDKIAADGLNNADWDWTDKRMERLQQLGIEPIVGLTHHGSGPQFTHLLDTDYAQHLSEFAYKVAERYPWVRMFTPVNEPNTTARFAALYGHWYPHATDSHSYLTALINQCKGIALSMSAIRACIPQAQLVQTEDMGKTYATPVLQYQARFENERRWLSYDLLCGKRLNLRMQTYLIESNISDNAIDWFRRYPCPPDVIGINHYVTSERFLDHRIQAYPEWSHGGNGRHRYADVEAVRVSQEIANIKGILAETWQRYERPIAITEAHLGDTATEQRRWLWERWIASLDARKKGIDVQAVCVWALFGSYYWNCLVTRENGCYEPAAFDARQNPPALTELGRMVEALAKHGTYAAVDLDEPGWWLKPERILYGPDALAAGRLSDTDGQFVG